MPARHEFRKPLTGYAVAVAGGGLATACLLGFVYAMASGLSDPSANFSDTGHVAITTIAVYGVGLPIAFGIIGAPLAFAMIRWIPPASRTSAASYIILALALTLLIGVWLIILSTSWNSFPVWLVTIPALGCGGAVAGYIFWRISVRPTFAAAS